MDGFHPNQFTQSLVVEKYFEWAAANGYPLFPKVFFFLSFFVACGRARVRGVCVRCSVVDALARKPASVLLATVVARMSPVVVVARGTWLSSPPLPPWLAAVTRQVNPNNAEIEKTFGDQGGY